MPCMVLWYAFTASPEAGKGMYDGPAWQGVARKYIRPLIHVFISGKVKTPYLEDTPPLGVSGMRLFLGCFSCER